MHARTSELLSLRDAGPIDASVAAHVEHCAQCARELQSLARARELLVRLPQFDVPPDAWSRIQQEIARSPSRWFSWPRLSAAAAVATLAIIIVVTTRDDGVAIVTTSPAPAEEPVVVPAVEPVASLVAQSQELEELLQALPQRPAIERVSTVATIDAIEQRIQWLDFQLSYAPEDSFDDTQAQRLWSERVELMDSLVKVRYAEAGWLSF